MHTRNIEHYLRPNKNSKTMAKYLPSNQANKIHHPVDSRRERYNQTKRVATVVPVDKRREMHRQTQRVATLVTDNAMWKELQKELAKSKVVSEAGVLEITRKFIQEREAEIDAKAKANSRSSNQLDYSRCSSLSMIAGKVNNMRRDLSNNDLASMKTQSHQNLNERMDISVSKTNSMRRALSVSNLDNNHTSPKSQRLQNLSERMDSSFPKTNSTLIDDQASPKSQRLQNLSERVNSSFSKINTSMRKLSKESAPRLPVRERFFKASSRSESKDDMVDILDQATTLPESLPNLQEVILSSRSCGGCFKGSDDDLLVLFPSQPRRLSFAAPPTFLRNPTEETRRIEVPTK